MRGTDDSFCICSNFEIEELTPPSPTSPLEPFRVHGPFSVVVIEVLLCQSPVSALQVFLSVVSLGPFFH